MSTAYVPPPDEKAIQHEGTQGLAINNTGFNRFLTLLALKTTAKFYSRHDSSVRISRHKIVKSYPWTHITEAATLKFVPENTSIPVPKVYCSFVRKNRAHIVMERIQGEEIHSAWKSLKLRALKPPKDVGVQSCIGRSLRDSRITKSRPRFGPFKSVSEFRRWLRDDLQPLDHPTWGMNKNGNKSRRRLPKTDRGLLQCSPMATWIPLTFLVRGEKIVGIIDWEISGWYPLYWEYTSAWLGNLTRTGWQGNLCKFLDQYPAELEMDRIRYRWLGDF
ncbi:hypothetical protein BDV12DRAFT_183683 [Aspergillus spectabilis]